jgi:RHS repeat-associated protein
MSICIPRSVRSQVGRNIVSVMAVVITLSVSLTASAAKKLNWQHRTLSAGKADLVNQSFNVSRTIGAPNFSPEFKFPVQMVYNSAGKRFGMLGYRWQMPQLESRLFPQAKKLEWVTPWGEKVYFFPKTKPDKNTLELYKTQMHGRGYFSPYADWEAFPNKKNQGNCTVVGKKSYKGWKFVYHKSRIDKVFAPSGRSLNFAYRNNKLTAVTELKQAFLTINYNKNNCAEKMVINGVEYSFDYSKTTTTYLPEKLPLNGSAKQRNSTVEVNTLAKFTKGTLTPTTLKYDDFGFLNQISQGSNIENLTVQHETIAERLKWLESYADARKDKKHAILKRRKFNGRILSDNSFTYSYPAKNLRMANQVKIRNSAGQYAKYDYNEKTGVLKVTNFAGISSEIFYFRRYDVAYNGKLRQVVDGRGRTTATYRYNKTSGEITRFRDMADNITFFDYNKNEQLIKVSRSQNSMTQPRLPLVKLKHDAKGNPVQISRVNAKGKAVTSTSLYYDRFRQVTGVKNDESSVSFKYNSFGRPTLVSDTFGRNTYYKYDKFNRVTSVTTPNHIRTTYNYDANGMISSITRTDASELKTCLSNVAFKYSPSGALLSYTDSQGSVRRLDRDAEGRITAEFFPDNSSVSYFYDKLGRLAKVLDQNRNPIKFRHSKFGSMARKTTAVGQITDYKYNEYGLLKLASSRFSKTGVPPRQTGVAGNLSASTTAPQTTYTHDKFDRVTKIDYGNGQTKSFTYNQRGKLLSVTSKTGVPPRQSGIAGNVGADFPVAKKSTKTVAFTYDIFDRLIKKIETSKTSVPPRQNAAGIKESQTTEYAYTKTGKRRAMKITFQDGSKKLTKWKYDQFGRLLEINDDGKIVTYEYDLKTPRLAKQIINGIPVYYSYTKYGQLESKSLGSPLVACVVPSANSPGVSPENSQRGSANSPISYVKYFYTPYGSITAREVNGIKQNYEYDVKNQLTAVKDTQGNILEQYTYDPAGNILNKTINDVSTSFEYDAANQLTSSLLSPNAKSNNALRRTEYQYDSAGRMIKEGNKTYQYGWLDKVMSISENGKVTANYDYHVSGQIASATTYNSKGERPFAPTITEYEWDGLALIKRGSTNLTNEPAVTGGNPILADNNVLFNDMLGTTLGVVDSGKINSIKRDAFGQTFANTVDNKYNMFTGKPKVEGLGYAFLFRNYRANLGKWQTADPLGYPDGWNNLAYVNNRTNSTLDPLGLAAEHYLDYVEITGTRAVIEWEYEVEYTSYYDIFDECTIITQTISYQFNVINYWDLYSVVRYVGSEDAYYSFYYDKPDTTSNIDFSGSTLYSTPGQLSPEEITDMIATIDGINGFNSRAIADEKFSTMNGPVTTHVYLWGDLVE